MAGEIVIAAGILAVLGAVVGYWVYNLRLKREKRRIEQAVATIVDEETDEATLEPADPNGKLWDLLKQWRHDKKAQKLAKKGYVKWYKIDATMPKPQWIKPTEGSAGMLEYYDDDEEVTYLFPKEPMLHDQRTGAWTAVHRQGEAEPINLRDPAMPPIETEPLERTINMEAESDAPGFFDRMNLDGQTMMWLMIIVVLGLAGFQQLMGGGG